MTRLMADGQGKLTNVPIKVPATWSVRGQFSITAQGQTSAKSATWPFEVTGP